MPSQPLRGTGLHVTGVDELIAKLSGLQGAELAKASQKAISRAARKVLAPRLAAAAPRHSGKGPQDAWPRGRMRLARTYTARKVRLRGAETAAYSVKARVWYAHLAIRGTKPHVIRPKAAQALFLGFYAAEVQHPGSQGNDYVTRAAQGTGDLLVTEMSRDLLKRFRT